MALASSSNEHEAAAALAKARALMDEHGIDDAALELAEFEEATARTSRNNVPPRWESILAKVICHALSVAQFIDLSGDRCFVGRGPRAEVASYAFAVLHRQIKKARGSYIAGQLKRCKPGRKRARADNYCEGWAFAVLVKIREMVPAAEEDEALGRYLQTSYPNLVAVNSRAAKPARAVNDFWRGVEGGSQVDLNAGIQGASQPLPLLGAST